MGSTADKAKGLANEAVGNIKQGVGKATDNDKMRAEGVVQEKKGEDQQAVGKTKDAVKKATKIGSPTNNHVKGTISLRRRDTRCVLVLQVPIYVNLHRGRRVINPSNVVPSVKRHSRRRTGSILRTAVKNSE